MPNYESVIIARQDISTQQVEGLTEQLTGLVTEGGGKVGKTEYWGLRNLSYRIKKNRKGHYLMLNVEAPAATLHEIERQLRLNEDVLRFQTIRTEELDESPSVMMQTRAARERLAQPRSWRPRVRRPGPWRSGRPRSRTTRPAPR